jgi:hypothetical protein
MGGITKIQNGIAIASSTIIWIAPSWTSVAHVAAESGEEVAHQHGLARDLAEGGDREAREEHRLQESFAAPARCAATAAAPA